MNNSLAGAGRICGEQDCPERTSRPNHPLCYLHYPEFQDGAIDECPDHPGVYKPSEYPICRSCFYQNQQPAQPARTEVGQLPRDDSKGWDRPPTPEPPTALPLDVVEGVKRVRRNLNRRESVNHESNTIQFLIMPILKGLGWDDDDPEQVIREYKPAGKQRFHSSIAVDIALLDNGVPKVFIEAKRLDREHTPEYDEQLAKYASHLDNGYAVLTNGKFWQFYTVANGVAKFQRTINIADGDAESAAREIGKAIGRDVIVNGPGRGAPGTSPQERNRPEPVAARPSRDAVVENLRQYREREAKLRRLPAYAIFKNEVIELIAARRPTDLRQLGNTPGIGPSTLQQHGEAIIKIVLGEGSPFRK